MQLRTDLTNHQERTTYLAETLSGLYEGTPKPAHIRGGRQAGLAQLGRFDPRTYAATRNDVVHRGVSQLSAYIRHGVISLAELRDYVVTRFDNGKGVAKFVNELAWRHFWQLVYAAYGDRIHTAIEPSKHNRKRTRGLPEDIREARTGLVCIDESLRELIADGYMHNHARMWVAAYIQHWRGIDWRDGADFYYQHLLDGDPASNSLSWQWVGSTFSHKPYFFNRRNVEKFSGGRFCAGCPLAENGCPFGQSYEQLAQQLFGVSLEQLEQPSRSGRPQR